MKKETNSGQFWNEDQLSFLKENYLGLTNQQLADHLGRSKTSVEQMLYKLRLRRPLLCQVAFKHSAAVVLQASCLIGRCEAKIDFALNLLKPGLPST